jgi:hypothetical protein
MFIGNYKLSVLIVSYQTPAIPLCIDVFSLISKMYARSSSTQEYKDYSYANPAYAATTGHFTQVK